MTHTESPNDPRRGHDPTVGNPCSRRHRDRKYFARNGVDVTARRFNDSGGNRRRRCKTWRWMFRRRLYRSLQSTLFLVGESGQTPRATSCCVLWSPFIAALSFISFLYVWSFYGYFYTSQLGLHSENCWACFTFRCQCTLSPVISSLIYGRLELSELFSSPEVPKSSLC